MTLPCSASRRLWESETFTTSLQSAHVNSHQFTLRLRYLSKSMRQGIRNLMKPRFLPLFPNARCFKLRSTKQHGGKYEGPPKSDADQGLKQMRMIEVQTLPERTESFRHIKTKMPESGPLRMLPHLLNRSSYTQTPVPSCRPCNCLPGSVLCGSHLPYRLVSWRMQGLGSRW